MDHGGTKISGLRSYIELNQWNKTLQGTNQWNDLLQGPKLVECRATRSHISGLKRYAELNWWNITSHKVESVQHVTTKSRIRK